MRNPWSRLAFLLLAPMALASVASGATTIQAQGGIRLVAVTSSVSGALLVNLRNILAALDAVANAQPIEVPAPALAGAHPSVRSRL